MSSSVCRSPSPDTQLTSTLEYAVECIQGLAAQLPDGDEMYRDERSALESFITKANSLLEARGGTDASTSSALDMGEAIGSELLTSAHGLRTTRNYSRSAAYSIDKSSTKALAERDIKASERDRQLLLGRLSQDVMGALDQLQAMHSSQTVDTRGIRTSGGKPAKKKGTRTTTRRGKIRNRIVPAKGKLSTEKHLGLAE